MKKKISRIWSVGLILMMCVSLLFWVAPVSADTLEWDDEDEPEDFEAIDIKDLVVSAGGLAIYVVTGGTTMYASGDTGESWEDAGIRDSGNISDTCAATSAAVAPDDPRYVGVVSDSGEVFITEDSGATWDTLGTITGFSGTANDIAVSKESGDNRFVAVAGTDGRAEIWYYEIGALGAEWEEISVVGTYAGFDDGTVGAALAFSPNFDSDEILVAVTLDSGSEVEVQVFSFNTEDWNDDVGGFSGYPLDLDLEDLDPTALAAADLALGPDYLGSDDDMRQIFVGVSTNTGADADQDSGIFFCDDDDVEALEDKEFIHSVDFDGTNLVAGSHDGTTVFMSDNPLEGDDADVDSSSSSKSPGGTGETVAAFAGGDVVVAGAVGDDSAFSISEDLGDNFNDITLIDGAILAAGGMLDFAVSADGSVKYLLTTDNTTSIADMSLWRLDNDLWERVRFIDAVGTTVTNYVIRLAPDDPDVIYLAEVGARVIYYSSDGGQTKWHNRTSRYDINDLAVETDGTVLYVLTTNGYVSKSVNTGFTWGSKETTMQAGDYTITSLGEDMLLVGGSSGTYSASYSTDGNESWTDLDEVDDAGNLQVCASGLADGDFIYAVSDAADSEIYRLEIGDDEWDDDLGTVTAGYSGKGIALADGLLYVLSSNGTDSAMLRFLDPSGDEAGDESTANSTADFGATPSALRVSAGSANLWAVDKDAAEFYNYTDTVSLAGPTLKSPSSGSGIPMNEISGYPADVNLVWECPSDEVTEFEIEIALDDGFDEGWGEITKTKSSGSWDEEDTLNEVQEGSGLVPEETYYWRVKVSAPVESPWSDAWSFTIGAADAPAPVEVDVPPAPEITVEMPAPEVTVTIPPVVQVPPAAAPITPGFIWGIIVIGALLVVALIVLILRTRRVV